MKQKRHEVEEAAVRVAPDRFTWMKYKGVKAKLLTHTKRNGDKVRTRLEPNDVYGYRQVKQRSTGKELIQVVLKSNDMDLAYNISPRAFNTNILKHSRNTVLPKKFKKPIDVKAIDKKDAPIVDLPDPAPRKPKPKIAPKKSKVSWMTEKRKTFDNNVLNNLNGLKVPDVINDKMGGNSAQIRIKMDEDGVPQVYLLVYDPEILNEHKREEILKMMRDVGTKGLYQEVTANSLSAVYAVIFNDFGIDARKAFIPASQLTAKTIKSNAHPGHRFLQVNIGHIVLDVITVKEPLPENLIDLGDGYTYTVEDEGTGHLAKFETPITLKLAHVIVWAKDIENVEPRMRNIKDIHLHSPHLKKRWTSKWGEVIDVQLSDAPRPDEPGSEMYSVVYADRSMRKVYGKDFDKTIQQQELEATPEYQEQLERERIEREARNKRDMELVEKERAHRQAIEERVGAWLDTTNATPMQRGKIINVLAAPQRYSGTINGIMSREEFVSAMVNDFKAKISTREELKLKWPTNRRWNRMDAYEQREFEKRYNLRETKTVYQIGYYDVTKYEYLYAQFLRLAGERNETT